MTIEMLELVDENDNVIGVASRSEIQKNGLLHQNPVTALSIKNWQR